MVTGTRTYLFHNYPGCWPEANECLFDLRF